MHTNILSLCIKIQYQHLFPDQKKKVASQCSPNTKISTTSHAHIIPTSMEDPLAPKGNLGAAL